MSLDVSLMVTQPTEVFTQNITHNLNKMAQAVNIYQHLWRPEELDIYQAKQLIAPLAVALYKLKEDPTGYEIYGPDNGWGTYNDFVKFVENYLKACIDNPEATVEVCR